MLLEANADPNQKVSEARDTPLCFADQMNVGGRSDCVAAIEEYIAKADQDKHEAPPHTHTTFQLPLPLTPFTPPPSSSLIVSEASTMDKEPAGGWYGASIGDALTLMKQNPADAEVQGSGCGALGDLAEDNQANANAIAANGGVAVVLTAMQQHPADAEVQKRGCVALEMLAKYHPPNAQAIAASGGGVAAKAAMQRHPTDADVQQWGQDLLAVLPKAPSSTISQPHTRLLQTGALPLPVAEGVEEYIAKADQDKHEGVAEDVEEYIAKADQDKHDGVAGGVEEYIAKADQDKHEGVAEGVEEYIAKADQDKHEGVTEGVEEYIAKADQDKYEGVADPLPPLGAPVSSSAVADALTAENTALKAQMAKMVPAEDHAKLQREAEGKVMVGERAEVAALKAQMANMSKELAKMVPAEELAKLQREAQEIVAKMAVELAMKTSELDALQSSKY
jgi:hypothetical protein